MSNAKQKTRMKPGTIAIIALSFVLVLSLITTITLAYFTATRNVTTTIKFANGVQLQLTGVKYKTGDAGVINAEDIPSRENIPQLYWLATGGGTMTNPEVNDPVTPPYGGYGNVNDVMTFEDMKVRTVDGPAFVAFKFTEGAVKNVGGTTVNLSTLEGYVSPRDSITTEWKEITSGSGWYQFVGAAGSAATAATEMPNEGVTEGNAAENAYVNTGYHSIFGANYKLPTESTYINNFAGITITFTVDVIASDTAAGLAALMAL